LKKKRKAKPKAKRVPLTEQRKLALSKKKDATRVKQLRELALSPPKRTSTTAWTVFLGEHLVGHGPGDGNTEGRRWGVDLMKAAGVKYRELSAAQREHYVKIASQHKAEYAANYRQWIVRHDPSQIKLANQARLQLKHKGLKPSETLKDERQVRRARNAWIFFLTEQRKSEDYKGMKVGDSTKVLAAAWKALPSAERKKYEDLVAQDRLRHEQEVKTVYGTNAPLKLPRAAPSESSAGAPDTIV
jgi:hypothetical protein